MKTAVCKGVASIRANFIPMVVLWAMACLVAAAYYWLPGSELVFGPIFDWQTANGKLAAFLNRAIFCGLLPGAFVCLVPSLRPPRVVLVVLAQLVWNGIAGIGCDFMYNLHALWFGTGTDIQTLLLKTLMSQFVWTTLLFAPSGALVYFWIGCDFSIGRMKAQWPKSFVGDMILPMLLSNWTIWIPVQLIVHLFPTPLQIQLSGFAGAFWCLVLLELGRRARRAAS